jgi:NB-ARC domain/Rx N-terminal domain
MADLLLSALIPTVLGKAADSLVERIGNMWGIDDQRERLHNMLLEIQAVLPDAEVQANSNMAVKSWLQKLKSAAYDADDLLDEFCYEELRRDAVRRGHKVGNVSDFFSLENPALFRYKMSGKLQKVVGRVDDLVLQMGRFGFSQGWHVQMVNRVRTNSLVVESKVVGRDEDKENLVKLLLEESNNADFTVVPLVGMGGIGKTTLAQLVYNDPRVKERFKLPLWVCVSEDFNIGHLVKSIIELVKGVCDVPIDNMELLQRRLQDVLGGKRYFLVLDDVWNEKVDHWEQLRAILNCGDFGSVVVVTTRSDRVAFIMGTVKGYSLGCLGEEDSWSLFHNRAFSKGVKECPELREIGSKMVQNCRGLPLAINALGSLMSYKHEVREWLAILDASNTWDKRPTSDGVLPVLRLSYDHLPPYMKQCFAFCAVFPKDYVINKEKLIQFWMANGFIPSSGSGSLEMKGSEIFNQLCWRSFFQEVSQVGTVNTRIIHLFPFGSEDGYCSQTKCKMHDLMHDLAQSITAGECLSPLEIPTQKNMSEINVRHISMKHIPLDINKIMDCFPSIRSLISTTDYRDCSYVEIIGFLKPNSLHILSLCIWPIEKTIVTPKKMKHLRYLEISNRHHITSLPEEISTLYLLQTLRLSKCWKLEKLPEGMRYMSTLRHLYIDSCDNLRSMPSGFGQLSCLQTLTNYFVGSEANNGIGELENLNLHGQLHIYNLREVRDVADASNANLIAKQNLDDLALCWGVPNDYGSSSFNKTKSNSLEVMLCDPFEVLDALKPCNKLKVLQITLYGGDKFPIWMMEYQMLENLVELCIIECRYCINIPPVEKLPFLRIFRLKHWDKLRHLCNSASTNAEGGVDAQIAFPSLKELYLIEMPNLHSWHEGEVGYETSLVFSQLKLLNITNCPKLTAMPIAPLLENLSIEGNDTLSRFARRLTKLQELTLTAENSSKSLFFQPWESLEVLRLTGYSNIVPTGANDGEPLSVTVRKCKFLYLNSCSFVLSQVPSNTSLWFWKCFTFIKTLRIKECDRFIYWPEQEFRSLNFLRAIDVLGCQNFLGSTLAGVSNTEVLLPNLQRLFIQKCPCMVEVPKCSASIRFLVIQVCTKLQCLPEWLGTMTALKCLRISKCDQSLNSLPSNIGGLINLEELEIIDCPNLATLPEGMEGLKALKELKIKECPKLRVLPEGLLQRLKNLDKLWIQQCPYLEWEFRRNSKYQHLISEIRFTVIGDDRKFGILSDLALSISSCKITCFSAQ